MTFFQRHRKTIGIIMCMMAILLSSSQVCSASDYVVKMKRKSGVYAIPCEVNGVRRDFIFDTGAANTSLSQEFVNELLQKRRLQQSDFTGVIQTRNASGVVDNNTTINIRQLKVGNRMIHNVRAIIAVSQKAPLLLGMNAIELLGEWTMRNDRLILHKNTEIQPIVEPTTQDVNDDNGYYGNVEREPEMRSGNTEEVRGNVSHPGIRLSAYNGDAEAQYLMGIKYLNGEGVPADPKMAVHWLRLSAAQGYKIAQLQLAECYSLGVGVEVDERRAEYWRKKAEEE